MSVFFEYRQISQEFLTKFRQVVGLGHSVVLLSPRYGGKRYVLRRLIQSLSETDTYPVVQVRFLNEPAVSTLDKARKLIDQAVIDAAPTLDLGGCDSEDLLSSVDHLHAETQKPILLIAANVDAIAHHLARRFLAGVRKRFQEGSLIAVLSGEDDLRDLVHGPNSEFNCDHQFVLQGFDEQEFRNYLSRYAKVLNGDIEFSEQESHRLWQFTGGNAYLMRVLLWAQIEGRTRQEILPEGALAAPERYLLKFVGLPGTFGAHVFRHATRIIARNPECWDSLESLIKGSPVNLDLLRHNAPTTLELAGVARREDNSLQFASEVMKTFIIQHYDGRRMGDLFAVNHQWAKAFEHYAWLNTEALMRPAGVDDKSDVEVVVQALCASLYLNSAKGIDTVKRLFIQGCKYVLGFPDVIFWQHKESWHLAPMQEASVAANVLEQIAAFLPQHQGEFIGDFPAPAPWSQSTVAAILPAVERGQQNAVIISDFDKRTVISKERWHLIRYLLKHFIEAYEHAINVKKTEIRLNMRNRHIDIINSIFNALGGQIINTREVIKMAARGLRQLGYKRVLFCLVDPERKRIQGAWDEASDGVDVAALTDWPLDDPKADLQPYVIFTKKPKIIEDARFEPLANLDIVDRAKMKSEAIVPILDPEGEAIGTIHVERADGAVPSRHEVDDLMVFAHQMAIAIEQSERVDLLQSALDKIPEPVIIADPLENVRYANKVARDLLQVPVGWQSRSNAHTLTGSGTDKIRRHLRETLQNSHRSVRHEKGIGTNSNYYGAVLLDRIVDWRPKTIGALIHIEDLNHFYRVFEALRLIAEADDTKAAMQAMLQAMRQLGHKWARLYITNENDPNRLVSSLCYGQLDAKTERKFKQGKVVLQSRNDPQQTDWRCIEKKRPLVFCYREDMETGAEVITASGLKAYNLNPPPTPPEIRKEPGEFWIDFPLVTADRVLGKMCLQCDANYRPEDFELLRILSERLLDALLRRDQEAKKKENLIRQTADSTIGLTAHNINSRFAGLSFVFNDYKRFEQRAIELKEMDDRNDSNRFDHLTTELKEINERFGDILIRLSQAIKRMKERLGPFSHHFEEFDLLQLIQRTLSTNLFPQHYQITSALTELKVKADEHLLDNAMVELIHNTKSILPDTDKMMITISVEPQENGSKDWVKITYRDNGPGIPQGLKEDIFKLFFSHRPGQEPGTGIGLGYVRRVAEAHGGTIREVSKQGEGAKFELVIRTSTNVA